MKVLNVCTNDIKGGAARAAYRIHSGLKKIGVGSIMFVKNKASFDSSVITCSGYGRGLLGKISFYVDAIAYFYLMRIKNIKNPVLHSIALFSNFNKKQVERINPDIVNLHWICAGFMKPRDLIKIKKPIVWTLHDMWAFCGAEHYVGKCERYINGYLPNNRAEGESSFDFNRWIWNKKKRAWKDLDNISIITPSNWLAECARKSILFRNYRINVIPNGIDIEIFKPINKKTAREKLGLPLDKKFILFGAMSATSDPRKGFEYLEKALKLIDFKKKDDVEIIVFGSNGSTEGMLPFPTHYLGNVNDDDLLVIIYSAADVMVIPSLEDNLPNTIMESISCGTPCVGFNLGGIPDMIDHKLNGYLAKPLDSNDLARGIEWVLEDKLRWENLSKNARKKVEENFSIKIVAKKYEDLYKNILENKK